MDSVARVQEKEKKSLFQGSNRLKLIKANFSVLKKSITATLEHKVQQAGGGGRVYLQHMRARVYITLHKRSSNIKSVYN